LNQKPLGRDKAGRPWRAIEKVMRKRMRVVWMFEFLEREAVEGIAMQSASEDIVVMMAWLVSVCDLRLLVGAFLFIFVVSLSSFFRLVSDFTCISLCPISRF